MVYRNPYEMYKMTYEQYRAQPKIVQDNQWNAFVKYREKLGFIGLYGAYQKEKAEREEIIRRYPQTKYLRWK